MKGILVQQKVLKAINKSFPDTMSDDQIIEANELAYTSIILHLSGFVLRKIGTLDDAQSLWKTLESTYLKKSLPNKLFLLEKIFSFKIDPLKDLDENFDIFNKLIRDVKNCGDKGIDEYKAIILLNSIPDAYKDVKSAIKYGRDDLTSPSVALNGKTPKEIWHDKPSDYSNLRIFGCIAYSHLKDDKLDPSRDIVFKEDELPCLKQTTEISDNSNPTNTEEIEVEPDNVVITPTEQNLLKVPQPIDSDDDSNHNQIRNENQHQTQNLGLEDYHLARDRDRRTTKVPSRFSDYDIAALVVNSFDDLSGNEPNIFYDAINRSESVMW
ncbi:Uncharacterized protein Adt_33528 [Abeliophyllum distichum]|uniref:Retrovirus-related Pol polyprotein from transposon TNT 1-94 n=1 Tax=Abeliophyllum distichum TaxID=126358 RepID=A0ABD1QXS7_9LAMI